MQTAAQPGIHSSTIVICWQSHVLLFLLASSLIQCTARLATKPEIHIHVQKNVNAHHLKLLFLLLIPSAAGPKTILNLCCIGQLVYAQSPLLAVLRIEVVNNGSAEAIKIVIAGLPIQGVRPFCFLIESAKVRITLVSSRRELASEIVVHITTAYNGQHERWKPAAPDHRTVPDINGWLPSAPCCR